MKNLLKMLLLLSLTTLLLSCATPSQQKLSEVTDVYQLPANYAQHTQQQKYYASTAGKLSYTDNGQGQVLVLLHGVPTSSWEYRKIIPDLQQYYRVISVDLIGFGNSEKPDDDGKVYTPVSRAKRVLALLKSLGVDQFSLLMHDMGGLVAWEMLRARSQDVTHLIILNTIVSSEGFNPPEMKPGMMTKAMTSALTSNLTSAAALDVTFNHLGLSGDYQLSEEECYGYVKPLREGSQQALYAFYTSFDDGFYMQLDDNKKLFDAYNGKSLVLWGGKDETLSTQQIPSLQQHLRIAEKDIHIFPNNNHFLVEEMPEEVIKLIVDFL